MNRAHYWQYVLNYDGQPVTGATITVVEDNNPSVLVDLYTSALGDTNVFEVSTDSSGFFEFWVDWNVLYTTNTTFSITITGTSIDTKVVSNVKFEFVTPRFHNQLITAWGIIGSTHTATVTHHLDTWFPLVMAYNTMENKTIPFTFQSISVDEGTLTVESINGFDPSNGVNVVLAGIMYDRED